LVEEARRHRRRNDGPLSLRRSHRRARHRRLRERPLDASRRLLREPEGRCPPEVIDARHHDRAGDGRAAFYEVFNKIAPYIYDAQPVAYNTSFDRRFLMHAVARTWPRRAFHTLPPMLQMGTRWIDVCPLARWCVPELPGGKYKLVKVAEHLGFDSKEAHRAGWAAILPVASCSRDRRQRGSTGRIR
jgi:hypothetical protein